MKRVLVVLVLAIASICLIVCFSKPILFLIKGTVGFLGIIGIVAAVITLIERMQERS